MQLSTHTFPTTHTHTHTAHRHLTFPLPLTDLTRETWNNRGNEWLSRSPAAFLWFSFFFSFFFFFSLFFFVFLVEGYHPVINRKKKKKKRGVAAETHWAVEKMTTKLSATVTEREKRGGNQSEGRTKLLRCGAPLWLHWTMSASRPHLSTMPY